MRHGAAGARNLRDMKNALFSPTCHGCVRLYEWPLIIHGTRSFRKYSRCRSLIPADTARNLKTEKQKNRAFPPFMSRREECAGRKKIFLGTYFSFIRARACTRDAYKNQAVCSELLNSHIKYTATLAYHVSSSVIFNA